MSWWDRWCWYRGRLRVLLGGLVWDKVLVLLLLALFVLGPERLPVVAEEVGKNLRKLRVWFTNTPAGGRPVLALLPGEPAPFDPDTT